ncbi:hypothetical protein P3S68_021240 [Capsicum galapagoense]
MVTSWILNSLSKDLGDSLQYVNNAQVLWKELEDQYDQANDVKLSQLQQEISELTQGNLDITGYYTKIRQLWEELNSLDTNSQCTCSCDCVGKTKMHKAEQDKKLIQFLMGLNEFYTVVRGSILMMNPLPTMEKAFSILVQEKKQREVRLTTSRLILGSTSLSVTSGKNAFRTNYSHNKHTSGLNVYKGHSTPPSYKNTYKATYPFQDVNRANLFCDYYKKSGHTEAKCYKLHG